MFDDGTLKVGRASNIQARLKTVAAYGERFGISARKTKYVNCSGTVKAELKLIKWCESVCTKQSCREWFKGVDFEECFSMAETIAAMHRDDSIARKNTDLMVNKLYPKTRTEIAYQNAKTRLAQDGVFNESVFVALDALHLSSERIRKGLQYGALPPQWFENLNVFGEWEEEMFFLTKEDSPGLFLRACADALEELEKSAMAEAA